MLALKYLVHFVGDVHQPLHASVNTGGEVAVSYKGNVLSLHYVWDKTCIAERSLKPIAVAQAISDLAVNVSTAEPAVWAIESRDAARDEIFSSGFFRGSSQPWVLPDSYCVDHWPLISSRLSSAGHRLAVVLNQLFVK
ncbi:hypothetical protein G6L28_22750 [Agrobacterium larrymoorei]|nr:hypothetical protein [Agrobacterium larrymoorei]